MFRKLMLLAGVVGMISCSALAQDTLYYDFFSGGMPALTWFDPWTPDSTTLTTRFVTGNPSGDGWVAVVNNASSGGGVGTELAGSMNMTNYEIQAQVYCTVSATSGGPYNGIVARWDTTGGNSYYSLRTDFDTNHRIQLRWFPGQSGMGDSLAGWSGAQIPGGVPTQSGWHRLGLKVDGNQIWAYYDDNLLSGSPFTDNNLSSGAFGVYLFKMPGDAEMLFDDVIALSLRPIDITLTPSNPPIVIPSGGGWFAFVVTIDNNTDSTQTFQGWTLVQLPNGRPVPIIPPISITLPANFSLFRARDQYVPPNAPAGNYLYRGFVGDHPWSIADSSSFPFTKLGSNHDWLGADGWICSGEPFPSENVAVGEIHPSYFILHASPNPFNPTTAISYQLSANSFVSLQVYDTVGRLAAELVNSWREAGVHEVTFDGSRLAAGIYFARLETEEYVGVQKMVLLK